VGQHRQLQLKDLAEEILQSLEVLAHLLSHLQALFRLAEAAVEVMQIHKLERKTGRMVALVVALHNLQLLQFQEEAVIHLAFLLHKAAMGVLQHLLEFLGQVVAVLAQQVVRQQVLLLEAVVTGLHLPFLAPL
jgi:hypothetical protein